MGGLKPLIGGTLGEKFVFKWYQNIFMFVIMGVKSVKNMAIW